MPAWPPYSSSTIAIWNPSWRSSASSGSRPQAVGDHDRLDHDVLDPGRRPLVDRDGHGVLDVDGADDGVLGVEHREAGVAGLPGQLDHGRDPVAVLDGRRAHARGHDLARGAGAELDRALHQLGGLGVEGALVGGALDQRGQLLRAARGAQLLLRLDAEAPHDAVGGAVEGPDRRPGERGEAAHEALGGACGLQRPGDRDVLRHHLAEDHGQHGAEREAETEGQRRHDALGQSGGRQRRVDQVGDGGLGQEADGQVGDRDADLGAGQLGGQRAQGELDALGAVVAVSGGALDSGTVDGHEGELRGHEQPAGGDQRQRHEQQHDGGHDALPGDGAVVRGL